MIYSFRRPRNPATVKATLLSIPEVAEFYARKQNQWARIDRSLENAINTAFSNILEYHNPGAVLEPLNPVETLDGKDLPELPGVVDESLRKYQAATDATLTPEMVLTQRLFFLAVTAPDRPRSILNVPPGLGKSTALSCYAAACADEDNRLLIVKRTVDDCEAQRRILMDLGFSGDRVAVMASYQDRYCKLPGKNRGFDRLFCVKCPYNRTHESGGQHIPMHERCAVGQTLTNQKELWAKPVIVMTHKRFEGLAERGKIPPDVVVVIDEAMSAYEIVNLPKTAFATIAELHPHIKAHHDELTRHCVSNCVSDVNGALDKGTRLSLKGILATNAAEIENLAGSPHTESDDTATPAGKRYKDLSDLNEALALYLRAYSIPGDDPDACEHYVFDNENSFDILRGRVDLDLPNKVVVLDGSATYSEVRWKDFVILELEEHRCLDFSSVLVHAAKGNPTKNHLKKTIGDYLGMVQRYLVSKPDTKEICLLINKDGLTKLGELATFEEWAKDQGVNVVTLEKGRIIGSNGGRQAEVILVTTSIFDGIGPYVLRTALRTHMDIEAGRIWRFRTVKETGPDGKPAYRDIKNPGMSEGFDDPEIDESFRRHYCDELIQYLMRSRARNYQGEPVSVFATIPGEWVKEELRHQLPGVRFADDTGMARLLGMPKAELEDLTDDELCGILGTTRGKGTLPGAYRILSYVYLSRFASDKTAKLPSAEQVA